MIAFMPTRSFVSVPMMPERLLKRSLRIRALLHGGAQQTPDRVFERDLQHHVEMSQASRSSEVKLTVKNRNQSGRISRNTLVIRKGKEQGH